MNIWAITLQILKEAFTFLTQAAIWLTLGFLFAGLVHEFVPPEQMVSRFGKKGIIPILSATGVGVLLPICSCGVIPAGIGLYNSGASLGATLSFMTATPAINPAAVMLSLALLGPKLTVAYFLTGFLSATIIGLAGNKLGGREIFAKGFDPASKNNQQAILETISEDSFARRLLSAIRWGFLELGTEVGFYIFIGFMLAGVISVLVPQSVIHGFFGVGAFLSLVLTAIVGVPLYVCAVGSIPLVAALIGKGALPGIAIVFLMTGPATNFGEIIAIFKMIGKRSIIIYVAMIFILSILGGYFTNLLLGASYHIPVSATQPLSKTSSDILAAYQCTTANLPATIVILSIMALGLYRKIKTRLTS